MNDTQDKLTWRTKLVIRLLLLTARIIGDKELNEKLSEEIRHIETHIHVWH